MIGNIAHFWRLTRELDLQGIRAQLERPAALRVLGSERALAERVARLIEPDPAGPQVGVGTLGEPDRWRPAPDVYVAVVGRPLEPVARRALGELGTSPAPLVVVQLGDGSGDVVVVGVPDERIVSLPATLSPPAARERLIAALVDAAPSAMLPLARSHRSLREPVARHVIRETARVNAQFAALSSLPANVPLVGGLAGNVADLLVLTKNQLVLLFKLAGLYGRDLELGQRLLLELLPVVGGAFFWRSAARSLVGLLPGALAVLPKTAVAYSGTFVVGEMARYYYQHGRRPPPELVRQLSTEGVRLARLAMARSALRPGVRSASRRTSGHAPPPAEPDPGPRGAP